ncbi:MAG: hypothetical protein ACM31C_27290 [Acidobacteriota bacterium]
MRIALLAVLAWSSIARADECAGEASSSLDCNALDKGGAMSLAIGWRSEAFDPAGKTFDVKRVGYVNTIGTFDGNAVTPLRGNGFYLDVRVHATPHWYAGVDLAATFAGAPAMQFATRGGDMIAWDSVALMSMAGVVGARVPLGRVSLRGELVGGIHGAILRAADRDGEADAPLVAPRVAVDVWLHRWWVLEAFAGTNLLDRAEPTYGVALAFHSQAFDGRY